MAFFEELFPPEISVGMTGGPRFINSKAYTQSGHRHTNRLALHPLHEYSLAQPSMRDELFDRLRAFFWVVGGDADAFRFKDWSDYRCSQANGITTEVSASVYQLHKAYTYGARTSVRPISKPVAGARIYRTRTGVVTDITAASTLDTTTGRVTVVDHLAGDTYGWAGEFHVPVAFRDSGAVWQWLGNSGSANMAWPSLEVEEVRT